MNETSIKRRQFLKFSTTAAISAAFLPRWVQGEDSIGALYQRIVPARKGLAPDWALALAKRGAALDTGIEATDKSHLKHVGMTVGGIGCGTVYLSGDGRLFVWDLFNQAHEGVVASTVKVPTGMKEFADNKKQVRERDGANYINPPSPDSHPNPFKQGFELLLAGEDKSRPLDGGSWSDVKFIGRWPLGRVEYADAGCPVSVNLEAWTPFVPLETKDSSLPVTVMEYTLTNRTDRVVKGRLRGLLENPVLVYTRRTRTAELRSHIVKEKGCTMLVHGLANRQAKEPSPRPDVMFEDFERKDFHPWTAEGEAFGDGPLTAGQVPTYQGNLKPHGNHMVNSHAAAPGEETGVKDGATGSLNSPEFTIVRKYIRLLLGGGDQRGKTGIEVLVDGKVVASATGRNQNAMEEAVLNVSAHEGRQAKLRIVDRARGAWGNTGADHIVFSDVAGVTEKLKDAGDYGSATLVALDDSAEGTEDHLDVSFEIPPSGQASVRFLIAWHFPNTRSLQGVGRKSPHYTARFPNAAAVARDVVQRFATLRDSTMRWVATWNDSTLPQWLLDRAILTTNTLQTTSCHIFADGRFWAWEGIGCCPGTCAHVWHYAQGVARLFPDLERNLREITDYGVGMNQDGGIRFRAEASRTVAIDSQTGIILRTWREHTVSPDGGFLKRVWPAAKRALEWLIRFDESGRGGLDGLLDGEQHNTLDAEWYGKVHCLCSLYLASLRAGQEMALAAGDPAFAGRCEKVFRMGSGKIATLFNGEYYIQEEDPAHQSAIGVGPGCYIDQVIGQWWATQVGLGRIYDAEQIRSALHSLWKYNFVPEIGIFRKTFEKGRFYAMPGEAGLVMCTWPKGGLRDDFKKHWQYGYFNECMTGFEWQAAAHMVQEGSPVHGSDYKDLGGLLENPADPRSLTARGLAVGRAIHDRYAPSLRNPYNEIECSDHYARANASYSLFLAACGFSYDGPAGVIGFAPKLAPEDFKAPFTAAEGWGTFEQKEEAGKTWLARIRVAHGSLTIREIRLPWITPGAQVRLGDAQVIGTAEEGVVKFPAPIKVVAEGSELMISMDNPASR